MRVTYFANDLSDAAVARRVRMLRAGGADVRLAGFNRSRAPVGDVEGVAAVDLGRTFDGKLATRAALVLWRAIEGWKLMKLIDGADTILARNLEMGMLAHGIRKWAGSRARLVYECLDIHSGLTGAGLQAKALRLFDRQLLRQSDALIVSSPGFLENYFNRLNVDLPSVILAENKRVLVEEFKRPQNPEIAAPPWRIGWFGKLRCVESFEILLELARRRPDLIEVELRGLPTSDVQRLIDRHLPFRNMRFSGSYHQSDLETMYTSCHFVWAIDYLDRGSNSDWLLPNRLYEGSFYNIPSIATASTETAAWLQARQTGIIINRPAELEPFYTALTMADYMVLQSSAASIPTTDLVWTIEGCHEFLRELAGLPSATNCEFDRRRSVA